MLACLVVIPLAALFGTKLPGIVQEFRGGGWQAATESARSEFSEAPPFQSAATERTGTERTGMNPTDGFQPATAWPTDSTGPTPSNGYPIEGAAMVQRYRAEGLAAPRIPSPGKPSHVTPAATFSVATPPAAEQEAMLASYESRVDPPWSGPGGNRPPGDGTAPASRDTSFWGKPTSDRPAGGSGPPEPTSTFDRFTYIQRRLRQLGATYYLLESWGVEGEYFRFHCRMAVGGNEKYTRHFEATEAGALEAMARVLSEVETWRGGW